MSQSTYESFGTTPAPEVTQPKIIESGHTPDELWRWKRAKQLHEEQSKHAEEMIKWAEMEIERLEKQ